VARLPARGHVRVPPGRTILAVAAILLLVIALLPLGTGPQTDTEPGNDLALVAAVEPSPTLDTLSRVAAPLDDEWLLARGDLTPFGGPVRPPAPQEDAGDRAISAPIGSDPRPQVDLRDAPPVIGGGAFAGSVLKPTPPPPPPPPTRRPASDTSGGGGSTGGGSTGGGSTGGGSTGGTGWRTDPNVSWYGPGFYGNRTACGQTYTTTIVGVAHKTLPCGTMVQFRYGGRVVTAPVIDRGPYVAGRQWDLSGALCTMLRHCFTGPLEWRFP
jgi:hypothetical protein